MRLDTRPETPSVPADQADTAALVLHALAPRGVASLRELSDGSGLGRRTTAEGLACLLAEGRIERLRPVGYAGEEMDFYRLRRPDDAACAWQRALWRYPSGGAVERGAERTCDPMLGDRAPAW